MLFARFFGVINTPKLLQLGENSWSVTLFQGNIVF